MIKSSILIRALVIVSLIITIFTISIIVFVVPKINKTTIDLEKTNAKENLNKIVTIAKNVHSDLESFKEHSFSQHKRRLISLTEASWSIIEAKHEQSKPEHISQIVKNRALAFKAQLLDYYNKNIDKFDQLKLKEMITLYIRMYRYDKNGYFFVNDFNSDSVIHPLKEDIEGKSFKNIHDSNGVYYVNEMVHVCKEHGEGIVKYQWENPLNNQIEDKISYVFTFEPFNWIIGTGEYYSTLNKILQDDVMDIVSNLRYDKNNYFYVQDYNGIMLSHPFIQSGKDMSLGKDAKGQLIFPDLLRIVKEHGSGFHKYWWKKDPNDPKAYEKITYVKDFPNWKFMIATGVYIDDIDAIVAKRKQELIEQLRSIVKNTSIGESGYLYIFTGNGKAIIHPNSNIEEKNLKDFITPGTNKSIFDTLVTASNTKKRSLQYKWDKPNDQQNYIYEKISWIEYLPELDWYVASSIYIDELESTANNITHYVIILSIAALIISYLLAFLFLRRLLRPLSQLTHLTQKVALGNYTIRSDLKGNDEIAILSNSINTMIDTTQNLIENLDQEVERKTIDLQNTNNKLHNANQEFSLLFDHAPHPIILINKKFMIKICNKEAVEKFPIYINNLQKNLTNTIIVPHDRSKFIEYFNKKAYTTDLTIGAILNNKRKNRYHLKINEHPTKADLYVLTFIDVEVELSFSEKLDKMVKKQTRQLSHAQKLVKMGSWEIIYDTKEFNISDEFRVLYGMNEPREYTLDDLIMTIHEDDKSSVIDTLSNVFKKPYEGSTIYKINVDDSIKNIKVHWNITYNNDNTIYSFQGYSQDITEQIVQEKMIQEQRDELDSIFQSTKDGLAVVDLESNFIDFNEAYQNMLLYSREELLHKSCISLSATTDLEKSRQAFEKIITQGSISNFEKSCFKKDGSIININMSASLLPDKQKIIISAKDVTEMKAKDLLLLEQSKMASMGDMIGNIAHQWRQPLSIISTAASGLMISKELNTLNDQDMDESLHSILRNTKYLSDTIDTFRTFIKGSSQKQLVKISDLVDEGITLAQDSLSNNHIDIINLLHENKEFDQKIYLVSPEKPTLSLAVNYRILSANLQTNFHYQLFDKKLLQFLYCVFANSDKYKILRKKCKKVESHPLF
jgi:PAS domain S-box-containing protein